MSYQDRFWSGQRCFVLGGGPSLKSVDLSRLASELTIGCNMAYRLDPAPSINVFFDHRVAKLASEDPAFKAYHGQSYWIKDEGEEGAYENVHYLRGMHSWSHSIQDGVIRASNCGLSAVNLADVLGAERIYLLGFDLNPVEPLTTNWHSLYPPDWATNSRFVYPRMVAEFEREAHWVRDRVVNLNPNSALGCFRKSTLGEVLDESIPDRQFLHGRLQG